MAATMKPAITAMSSTEATTHWWLVGMAWPPLGAATRKNPPSPATIVTEPSHSFQPRR